MACFVASNCSAALTWSSDDELMPRCQLAASAETQTYTIDDVLRVTRQEVDPIPSAADDEYSRYTIVLKDGTVRVAKVAGLMQWSAVERTFRETGYIGSVKELLMHQ